MATRSDLHLKQKAIFPGQMVDKPWDSQTTIRRHFLSFPFYPFRTVNTRELTALNPLSPFGSFSPIFPAHTQLNISFKRRPDATLLNYMLPYNLNYETGSSSKTLTAAQRLTGLTYTVKTGNTTTDYKITGIEFVLKDIYLQVLFSFFHYFWLNNTVGFFKVSVNFRFVEFATKEFHLRNHFQTYILLIVPTLLLCPKLRYIHTT
jgi:hypothetical protein